MIPSRYKAREEILDHVSKPSEIVSALERSQECCERLCHALLKGDGAVLAERVSTPGRVKRGRDVNGYHDGADWGFTFLGIRKRVGDLDFRVRELVWLFD